MSTGGGIISGAGGSQGGGLCVFTCSTILSAFGAVAALADYDLGQESAFFTVQGLGALCFAKCQYLRLAQEKSRGGPGGPGGPHTGGIGGQQYVFDPSFNHISEGGAGGWRKRREDLEQELVKDKIASSSSWTGASKPVKNKIDDLGYDDSEERDERRLRSHRPVYSSVKT